MLRMYDTKSYIERMNYITMLHRHMEILAPLPIRLRESIFFKFDLKPSRVIREAVNRGLCSQLSPCQRFSPRFTPRV